MPGQRPGCGGIRASFQNEGEDSLHVGEEKEKGEKKRRKRISGIFCLAHP